MTENESILSAMGRHELRNIQLPLFFNTIRLQLQNANIDTFQFIDALRTHGLRFTAQEKGLLGYDYAVHPGDVSVALLKLNRVLANSNDAEVEKAWRGITVTIGASGDQSRQGKLGHHFWVDDEEHATPIAETGTRIGQEKLGQLWVNEDDFADACGQLGMDTYLWPKVKRPLEFADLEGRRCLDQSPVDGTKKNASQSPENTNAGPRKKPAAFDRRCNCLRLWLTEVKQIPKTEWNALTNAGSKREIYQAMIKYDAFKKAGGEPIAWSTFSETFWPKQEVCRLPDRNE
jgi:hypothetical protein